MDPALESLVDQVRRAAATGTPLAIRGAGTKDFLGEGIDGVPLEMGVLAGIVDYDPAELVVTVRAGTALADVESALAAAGQMLPFEPPRFGGGGTMGGAIAAGLAGPRRASHGTVRDFVLGATLLAGTGELLRFGGRVMKNVAGYDVARLLCGSLGVLGPVVELSIKVLPLPACECTLEWALDAGEAIVLFNRAMRQGLPVSATSWIDGRARMRLSGATPALESARRSLGGDVVPPTDAARWWSALRDHRIELLAARTPLWRVVMPATRPPEASPRLVEWCGGLRWFDAGIDDEGFRTRAQDAGGAAALWHGGAGRRMFAPLPPAVLAIQQRLKSTFDPAGIFNRGRLDPAL